MSLENVVGWTVTALLLMGVVLRWLTVTLNRATATKRLPSTVSVPQGGHHILVGYASLTAGIAVAGSIWLPLQGLWGPAELVFAVIWGVNNAAKVRYLPWLAPIQFGLERGERITLLGGSFATLIGYLISTL